MRNETYKLEVADSSVTFEFISEGPKGGIKKRVQYQKIAGSNLYNLAFGDVNIETDKIDDKVISNNNDAEKILATVAKTVSLFMNEYPNASVHAKGSTFARTRLYRIGISNNLDEISKDFDVLGLLGENNWVIYERNIDYSAFLIMKK
jgi:hypothetical protein